MIISCGTVFLPIRNCAYQRPALENDLGLIENCLGLTRY